MLQRIRDNASGPLAYVIVGLISLVFGVWGIGSYFTPSANPEVAVVGDIQITRYQLQQAYNERYRQLRAVMGERFDPQRFKPDEVRRAVLQQLIQSAVLDQYAIDAGYRTPDQALLRVLTSNPRFQVNGKFSTQRYEAILANAGLTPTVFEASLRRNLVTGQVRAGVVGSAFAAPPAVQRAYGLLRQQRELAYLVFPRAAYADQVQVEPDEVQAWYEAHQDQYMRPERVKLAYVELTRNTLQPDKPVTEDALRSLYQQNKARFSTPERRDGRQILVPVTAANAAQARQTIQSMAAKLAQGQSFDDVAGAAKDAVKLSTLDDVSRAELPDDVADALFGTEVGQVSTPVRGAKGWYLLKPTAVQPGETQPFEAPDVQAQLQELARTQWQNERFGELAERMETLAFQAPNGLQTLTSELGLEIRHTGWVTRAQGQGLAQSQAVRDAAFADAVLNERLNSTAIQVDENHRVVLRVVAHEPPQALPLDKVRDQVLAQLKADKAAQLAQAAARQARETLANDDAATLKSIAAATPAELQSPGTVGRSADGVPPVILGAAFALPAPSDGKPVYDVVSMADGAAALVALRGVKTAAATQGADDDAPAAFVQRHRAYVAELEYMAFANYLNEHAEVEIRKQQLQFE